MMKKTFLLLLILFLGTEGLKAWGFFAHRRINRLAVFSLPIEMVGFFKENIQFITENAVNPDRRRYAVEGEAEKHFIDADVYGDSAIYKLPRYWGEAVESHGEDTLRAYGIGPWNVHHVKMNLTDAFERKDTKSILRLAADLGHYIGDINVPLHTTENYNGQLTDQHGIHGFWESRIPELLSDDYDFFVGKATYIENTQLAAWNAVIQAHQAVDSVLRFERELSLKFSENKKYSFIDRGNLSTKSYSREFTKAYSDMLNGQVERQMRRSIKMTADFWYTAWVDAGQPDLNDLLKTPIPPDQLEEEIEETQLENIREH
ncbi:MAG TPA: zinc dependent phospholipase C family protein [Cyclobacteriaceae bacterium]|nr:zinc dependent phospholipase C family protein [Cyclobacteriaceae bacterium]